MRLFISYSHRDEESLKRLHVHLAALRREGRIEDWFDREILAGDKIDEQIGIELETAELFLLLVSPDFIASDYCVEVEMQRASERHEAGSARIVPIIIEPCEWAALPLLRQLKALPKDGKPISEWANANNAYLDIIQELRRIIEAKPAKSKSTPTTVKTVIPRYRVKRDFDEIDRSEFCEEAFISIRDYFKQAITELDSVEGLRGRFVDIGAMSFGSTVVNSGLLSGTAHITVHRRNHNHALADIYYSFNENAQGNAANGGFSISSDEYEQFLVASLSMYGNENEPLTSVQAAEQLWNEFIEQAGITHD